MTSPLATGELSRYNGFNQLVETNADGVIVAYTYYPNGLRASKNDTKYILDGGNVVLEATGSTITGKYIRAINLIASVISGTTSYYLYNAHGDVVQLASASGAVTRTYTYDAFGVEKNPSDNDANPFRYCGEYWDKETGTYYLRARYYSPGIGRFTAEDTYRGEANDPLSLNLYT